MKDRIWLSLAHMGGREQEFIQEAFDTNWVVPLGPNVNAFEKALRDFLIENGEKQVVAAAEGNRILVVEYDGQSDMKEKTGIIKEILEKGK